MPSVPPKIKTLAILTKTIEKQKLNFSRSVLFYMKTRVFLIFFLNDCRCFSVKFEKFLRIPFFTEHLWATASKYTKYFQYVRLSNEIKYKNWEINSPSRNPSFNSFFSKYWLIVDVLERVFLTRLGFLNSFRKTENCLFVK